MRTVHTWDVFCRVVDNFGDAAVCWRLARQLAAERAATVRLWIDDLESLHRLDPAISNVARQTVRDVEVRRWADEISSWAPPDVVIEAFGCGLPESYLEAMARASPRPLWIVLEYLSAEPWVPRHHGLPSLHPRFPLERYFFFPGFVHGTGGVLREAGLFARRDAFGEKERVAFWRSVGHPPPGDALTASIFAYDAAPLTQLFECWERGSRLTIAAVPESPIVSAALSYFGATAIPRERVLRRGALEVRLLPFVPQARYDELLWCCDCNFVRGEDSFVRAQWAARSFVWHIYPQKEDAHHRKLEAFLALYCNDLPADAARAVADLTRVWNQIEAPGVSPASAWAAFVDWRGPIDQHTRTWADRLVALGGLSKNLAGFCRDKLK